MIHYGYDQVGKRTTQTKFGATTTYSYDAADELGSSTTGGTTTAFGYDYDGNEIVSGSRSFAYDLAGMAIPFRIAAKKGNTGYADILLTAKSGLVDEAQIWEVKPSTYEFGSKNREARDQLARYLAEYRKEHPGTTAAPGTPLSPETDVFIPGVLSELIDWGRGSDVGLLFYTVAGPRPRIPNVELSPQDAAWALLLAFMAYGALKGQHDDDGKVASTCLIRIGCTTKI